MELVKHFALVLLLLVCQETTGNINRKSTENKDRIEILAKLLRETVKPDLELFAQKFDAVVNEINTFQFYSFSSHEQRNTCTLARSFPKQIFCRTF